MEPVIATATSTDDAAAKAASNAHKEWVAFSSVLTSGAITIGKLVAGLLSGSLALMSEAAHALVDTGATLVTWLAVRAANKPADAEHHYGHGKFESLAALIETVVLFVLATVVVYEAWHRLQAGGGEFEPTILAFAVLGASILVDLNRVRVLRKTAKETNSQALAADAIHFASDLVGSILVLIGLAATVAGFKYGDALAALGVALFIAIAGVQLGKRTIDTLLDRAPEGVDERLRKIVLDVPGVVGIDQLRLRPGGTHLFGDIAVVVSRTLPLERVDAIKKQVVAAVRKEVPEIELDVNATPKALDDETVLERVLLVAAHCRTPVHHVIVQMVGTRLSVSLDLEVDGRLSLGAAHARASKIEAAIRDELGADTEVETHIEPLVTRHLEGTDAPADQQQAIAAALMRAAAGTPELTDIHNIRVRQTDGGLVVYYHCRSDADRPVAAVHYAVDELERVVRGATPGLLRLIGHAEPLGKAEV